MKKFLFSVICLIISGHSFAQLSSNALHFDGIDDAVLVGYVPANYDINKDDFTVEAWIKDEAPAGGFSEEEIFSTEFYSTYTHARLRVCLIWGQLTAYVNGQSYALSGSDLRDNTCHHIAVSRIAGTITGYVDGNQGYSNYAPDSIHSNQYWTEIKIGCRGNIPGTYFNSFKGLIKEVRFWHSGRTGAQISSNMNTVLSGAANPSLIGYWRFNEGSGTTVNDYSLSGNAGTVGNGSAGSEPLWVTGCSACTLPAANITAGSSTTFCTGGSVVLSANTGTGLTYQWFKNTLTISGATASSYSATTAGSYTCAVTNSCGIVTSNAISVTVNSTPTATINPSGPIIICSGSSVTLVTNTGVGYSYQWKLNGSVIAGATYSSYGATAAGSFTVTTTNACGSSTSSPVTVTVQSIPASPGTITAAGGNTKVCPGDTKTYSITAVSGATNYTWTPPAGSTITNGQGTLSVTVNYTSSFTASDTIRVIATNSCGSSAQSKLKISRNTPATPGTITGQTYGTCNLTNIPYSVTNVSGITYSWSFSVTTASIITGQGTNAISANFGSGYSSGAIRVSASNACGTSALRSLTVKSTPATPGAITGATSVCANQQSVPYSISPVATATSYTWTGMSGSHISDGVTTSVGAVLTTTATSVTVNFGSTSGILNVKANNPCGSGSNKSKTIGFTCRDKNNEIISEEFNVTVYPNPSSSDFVFDIENANNEKISISVYDMMGRLIETNVSYNTQFTIRNSQLKNGIYSTVVTKGEQKRVLKLIKTD